jgi:hypothetical protein
MQQNGHSVAPSGWAEMGCYRPLGHIPTRLAKAWKRARICRYVSPRQRYTLPTLSWREPMAILPGRRLGPYEILSAIGAGGMGEVYKARDPRLDRIVAIKVLPTHLADRSELRERFEREAKTIASLNHPHICTLFDIGQQDGIDYLVMEYLEGETLAQRLLKGALPLEQVLQYAIEISDALDRAHRKGVTHRDLTRQHHAHQVRDEVAGLWFGEVEAGGRSGQRAAFGTSHGERSADGARNDRWDLAIHGPGTVGRQGGGCADGHFRVWRGGL